MPIYSRGGTASRRRSRRLANGLGIVYTGDVDGIAVLFVAALGIVVAASFAFWIWMLIDCVTKEPDTGNTKICWVLIIVFAHIVGALIYFFVRRDQRYAEAGR